MGAHGADVQYMCGVEWVSDEGVMCGIVEYNGWIYVETGWGTD